MKLFALEQWQDVWEEWGIRICILGSLLLQCFLILVSPLRKRSANILIYMLLWSAYLVADWIANYVVGQISSSQSDKCSNKKGDSNNTDLLAFWAPFLLVHLGGPDTISAFSLEDNELWRRHLLTLVFQSISAGYVFFQSLPGNVLWIPTVCMFISGVAKYAERTRALLLASVDCFRDRTVRDPDPGPNYAKLMNKYYSMKEAHLPTSIKTFTKQTEDKTVNEVKEGRLNDTEVVLYAHQFFQNFKGVIVDVLFSSRERDSFRNFFRKREAEDAFKVIEVELNFIYDVFFTKVNVVYHKWGYFFRFISSSLAISSLGLFYFEDKGNFRQADVAITYTLLIGAIVLDVIAFGMLVFSDWSTISIRKLPTVNIGDPQTNDNTGKKTTNSFATSFKKLHHMLRRRWSESMSGANLIRYARLNNRPKLVGTVIRYLGLNDFLDSYLHVKRHPFTKGLRDLIFEELKTKSNIAKDDLKMAKQLSEVRGEWSLISERCDDFIPYILEKDYDESVLLWHVATELYYQSDEQGKNPPADREYSKRLSDYMLCLLVLQRPSMMSTVAGIGQIRFNDTCAEAQKLFGIQQAEKGKSEFVRELKNLGNWVVSGFLSPFMLMVDRKNQEKNQQEGDCKAIRDVHTEVEPVRVKGDKSKSVLFDGSILAKKLMMMEDSDEKKWRVISKVWVEMLSYAAINCRANRHTQQLSRGGELLTLVWILMIQLGLGSQFQISEGHERAKLLVGK